MLNHDNLIQKKVFVLGVSITNATKEKVLRDVRSWVLLKKKFYMVTPNPEIVMLAQEDEKLKNIINFANISLPDGIGLVWAASLLKKTKIQQLRGRQLFLDLLRLASKLKWRVFLVGASAKVNQKTLGIVSKTFSGATFDGDSGPRLTESGEPINEEHQNIQNTLISTIKDFKPHLIFVAFGAPKQEKWLYKWLPRLPAFGGMVVGGAFDYISGEAKLPPKLLTDLHLEWLWRLITQPLRAKRIIKAVVVFPLKVLGEYLRMV